MDLWDFQNNFQRNINRATIVERNVDSYLCKAIILKIKKKNDFFFVEYLDIIYYSIVNITIVNKIVNGIIDTSKNTKVKLIYYEIFYASIIHDI